MTYLGLDGGGPRLRFRTAAGASVHLLRSSDESASGAGSVWDAVPYWRRCRAKRR